MKIREDKRKTIHRNNIRSKFRIFVILVFHILYSVKNPVVIHAEVDKHWLADSHHTAGPVVENAKEMRFKHPAFIRMIEIHDQYLPELDGWRRLFARHAKELARLLKTFPGGEHLHEEYLHQVFSYPETIYDSLANKDVFAPWVNRWSGEWSNGTRQYHIWDSTYVSNDRIVQAVTLSESQFVNYGCLDEMLRTQEVDIAINVVSPRYGITGWVSKTRNGQLELPHIGYWVNDTTLVWICQIKEPGKLFARDQRWFVFLETVNTSANPAEYRIYGQPVVIKETFTVETGQRGKHCGVYYSHPAKDSQLSFADSNYKFPEVGGGHGS
jgi:hypothetical protein